ncbi:SPOR domain-containing protein [Endozoicomonas arenosclerae]|uniref:SPOR domain-containing protein n=1 Tax=Endozoicomonas arenosclerae TaxID=1633495 RepID=UPI0007809EA6|nr:SPOR domain-containing protein [Endozoicomonas arenosclerae]
MSARELFMDKPLRLGVVAALATLTAVSADALLLPPKPLALSSSWDCRSGPDAEWLCRNHQTDNYDQPLENVAYSAPERNNNYQEYVQPERTRPSQPEPETYFRQEAAPPAYQQPSRYQPPAQQQPTQQRITQLLSAQHGSFVIQWLATHTEEPLIDLQRRFPVLQQATIVRYQRKNKDWFVLLDGPFKDRQSAMTALNSPPRLLMTDKLYPWTRSLASIQKLNLIMPGELREPDDLTRPSNNERYAYQEPVRPDNNRLFASIAPAYPQVQQQDTYRDYNTDPYQVSEPRYQTSNQAADPYYSEEPDLNYSAPRQRYAQINPPVDRSRARKHYQQESYSAYSNQEEISDYRAPKETREYRQPSKRSILEASQGSYAIQWLAGPRRDTLERVRRRYEELRNAQIIHYRKGHRDWYLLVGSPYSSKSRAQRALNKPELARVSTRLYPRIRGVEELQGLINGKPASTRQAIQRVVAQPQNTIISGSGKSYTIQWFAANQPEAIERMKKRFPELKSAVTARYRKNQKDWYVLLQGQFTSSKEALAVIKSPQLKDAVRVLHPWTRSVKSLKKLKAWES